MIERLILENFESHLSTDLPFHPGLNVFVGDSDKGKSGVFRGFKLLTQNKPGGEWMRPLYWDGTSKVTGHFIDPECTIQRIRGKGENVYILNDEDPVSAGTSVPENIATLINMDTVNIQTQVERAFLMFEKSGERGRILNKISGLDEIDLTLNRAKKDVNRLTRAWGAERDNLSNFEKELEGFVDIEAMEERVSFIERKENRIMLSRDRIKTLSDLAIKLKNVEIRSGKAERLIECESTLLSVESKIQGIADCNSRIGWLFSLSKTSARIEQALAKDNFDGAEEQIEMVWTLLQEIEINNLRIKKLIKISRNASTIEQEAKELEIEIKELEAAIPNICPECGSEYEKN